MLNPPELILDRESLKREIFECSPETGCYSNFVGELTARWWRDERLQHYSFQATLYATACCCLCSERVCTASRRLMTHWHFMLNNGTSRGRLR